VPNWDAPGKSAMWEFLEQVVSLFTPSLEAITILEADHYPSQSLILLLLYLIERQAIKMIDYCKYFFFVSEFISSGTSKKDTRSLIYIMASNLKEGIQKLWDELPRDVLIASVLDPRTKKMNHVDAPNQKEAWECLTAEFKNLKEIMAIGIAPPLKKIAPSKYFLFLPR
jgi:hypothetical protein